MGMFSKEQSLKYFIQQPYERKIKWQVAILLGN